MMKRKNKSSFPLKSVLLLGGAAVLLLGSTVGSTRAALTYYNEEYSAQVSMSSIGVALLENDEEVNRREYTDDGTWLESGEKELLTDMLAEGESVVPGEDYDEKLSVANVGNIDTFVRVILTRYWTDSDGREVKATELDPELIVLNGMDDSWLVDERAEDSPERMILYYKDALAPNTQTYPLSETLRIDPAILNGVVMKETKSEDGTTISRSYEYKYNGYTFHLEAEVNAVQTHNAADAIKSAWGIDVNVSADGQSISLAQ